MKVLFFSLVILILVANFKTCIQATQNSISCTGRQLEMPENPNLRVISMIYDSNFAWKNENESGAVTVSLEYTPPLDWDLSDLNATIDSTISQCRKVTFDRGIPIDRTFVQGTNSSTVTTKVHHLIMHMNCAQIFMLSRICSKSCGICTDMRDARIMLIQRINCNTVTNSGCTTARQVRRPYCAIKNFTQTQNSDGSISIEWEMNHFQRPPQATPKYHAVRVGHATEMNSELRTLLKAADPNHSLVVLNDVISTHRTCDLRNLTNCQSNVKTLTIPALAPGTYGVQICEVFDTNMDFPDGALRLYQTKRLTVN